MKTLLVYTRAVTGDESERLRKERDLFSQLLELGACEDLRPLVEEALGIVVSATRAQRGYLEIQTEAARVSIARDMDEAEVVSARAEMSRGIVAAALAEGRTISTASAMEDPRFSGQPSVQAGRIRAVLCAPIGAGPALGVLYLAGRRAPGPFPEEDRLLCERFARYLAPFCARLIDRDTASTRGDATAELRSRLRIDGIAGTSRALADVFHKVAVAAAAPIHVLLTGETGTGKTALARAIHASSPRAAGPFVEVNCAAIPEALFESELFGADKGAHSTATRRIAGKVETAHRGTLLLDEIGEMPLVAQAKLLTFLQGKRFYRLGGAELVQADVRIIAATNADLVERVAEKRFREDLFWRLDVLAIRVPPLRERPEDVAPIAVAIVDSLSEAGGRRPSLSHAARVALADADWPGNVRQLENTLQRGWATAAAEGAAVIEPHHLFPDAATATGPGEPADYAEAVRRFQRRFLSDALGQGGWNVSETARRLGLARSHLNDLIRAHGLSRPTRES